MKGVVFIFLFVFQINFCQEDQKKSWEFSAELVAGKTMSANYDFPEKGIFKGVFFAIGKETADASAMKNVLNISKTGLLFGASDYGNNEKLGQSYAIMPFFEMKLTDFFEKPLTLQMAFGGSFQNKGFDPIDNFNHKGISRPITWCFRMTFYQEVFENTNLGLGFYHQSNGHTRFPNQGLNSFFGTFKYDFSKPKSSSYQKLHLSENESFWTFTSRYGLGVNTMSYDYNQPKPVHVFAIELAKTYKQSYKIGFGVYYRFYQHYYDYLNEDGEIAQNDYPQYLNSPGLYASNFGVNGSFEIFLNHFGAFIDLGINLYKPFYAVDWKLHQEVYINGEWRTKDLDLYFDLKKAISSRMGLKYYWHKPGKNYKHNFFVGAAINANLGQADFSELTLGYVKRIGL